MLNRECVRELEQSWLPNITNAGLERIIDLLRKDSPLLIHGCFAKAVPMGCLATHIAWHHPVTEHSTIDAGIYWLHHVAHLNPATSLIIREWDTRGRNNWDLRMDLVEAFDRELRQRKLNATSDRTASPCEISAS